MPSAPLQAFILRGDTWKATGRTTPFGDWIYGPVGSYKPGPTTSGKLTTSLPTYPSTGGPYGDLTTGSGTSLLLLTTAGVTVQGYRFPCSLQCRAANITVRDCEVVGGAAPTGDLGLIESSHADADNVVIADVTIKPTNPTSRWNGIQGEQMTVKRVDISGVTDAFRLKSANGNLDLNTLIQAPYVHDLAYDLTDPNQGNGPTHNDGFQIEAVPSGATTGITVEGFNISAMLSPTILNGASRTRDQANAAVQFNPRAGYFDGVTFRNGWMSGGGATVNLAQGTTLNADQTNYHNVKFTNIVFEVPPGSYNSSGYMAIIVGSQTKNLKNNDFVTGNRFSDGRAFAVSNGGNW